MSSQLGLQGVACGSAIQRDMRSQKSFKSITPRVGLLYSKYSSLLSIIHKASCSVCVHYPVVWSCQLSESSSVSFIVHQDQPTSKDLVNMKSLAVSVAAALGHHRHSLSPDLTFIHIPVNARGEKRSDASVHMTLLPRWHHHNYAYNAAQFPWHILFASYISIDCTMCLKYL